MPCKQVFIPKQKGKVRELNIPTIKDRIIQQALLNILTPIFESSFSAVSFAYRPNLSYIQAVEKIAQWRDSGYYFVLDADIIKFFDNINHHRLLKEFQKIVDHPLIINLIQAWITVGKITSKGKIKNKKGIPQGAVISPLLANLYLTEFDRILENSDLKLVRYADDFVVLANNQERIITAYYQVTQILADFHLQLHEEKSQITNFDHGFRFLGHGFLNNAIFPLQSKSKSKKKSLSPEEKEAEKLDNLLPNSLTITDKNSPQEKQLHQEKNNLIHKYWNQAMATIYLTQQGSTLSKNQLRFIIQIQDNQKIQLPVNEVERIILFGNIHLTTPVMNSCLKNKIMVVFANQSGNYRGHLWSGENFSLKNHFTQFERRNDGIFQLNISRNIVFGKLYNSKQLLLRFNRKGKNSEIQSVISQINHDLELLKNKDNIDTLRGYEGINATRYFPAFGQLITNPHPTFAFSLRTKQPPKDAVNSLLSFGYTLLYNNVLSLIIAEGLSPYIANFHYGEKKKPYLAFDLMEEFRSIIVDSLVLKLVNKSIIKPEDFDRVMTNQGVYISGQGRRLFIKHFEDRMNEIITYPKQKKLVTYRQAIQAQIRSYKHSLLEDKLYQPFLRTP